MTEKVRGENARLHNTHDEVHEIYEHQCGCIRRGGMNIRWCQQHNKHHGTHGRVG